MTMIGILAIKGVQLFQIKLLQSLRQKLSSLMHKQYTSFIQLNVEMKRKGKKKGGVTEIEMSRNEKTNKEKVFRIF